MYQEITKGEILHQKELFKLSKKGKRKVSRIIYKGGDSDGKGAIRMVVTRYESQFAPKSKKRKAKRRVKAKSQKTTYTQSLINSIYNS